MDSSKLSTSWTRYSIVHLVELISAGDLDQIISDMLDPPVIRAFLGTKNLNNIPDYWSEVLKHKNTRCYFALLAALFTHSKIVHDFNTIYTTERGKGVFRWNSSGTAKANATKMLTNIRSALIAGNAASEKERSSKVFEFDFSALFLDGALGPHFKQVLIHRLDTLGYSLTTINSNFTQSCTTAGFLGALGLSEQEFNLWLSGTPLEADEEKKVPVQMIPPPPFPGLVHVSSISNVKIRAKYSPVIFRNGPKSKKAEYLENGWTLAKRHKKSYRYEKPKPHFDAFEEKVWAVFAKAGFTWLNMDSSFKLATSTNINVPQKQIDVIAISNDSVILVECKSADTRRKRSFQKDIAEIGQLMKGIGKTLESKLGKDIHIAWVLATNKYVVSQNDRHRMDDIGLFHFDQDEIEYWWQVANNLDHVTKYQLYGRFFKNEIALKTKVQIPAIKGEIRGNSFYTFSLQPELLLQIGFVLHRTDTSSEAFESYQRMVKGDRIRKINSYISVDGKFFPNSIIVNFQTFDNEGNILPIIFDPITTEGSTTDTKLGLLTLPNKYRSCFIIDGQHRVFGYGNLDEKYTDLINVIAFDNLPAEDQTQIFIDINHKQVSVPANLLRTMMSEFNWGSSSPDEALDALKTKLIHRLTNEIKSPLYNRIVTGEERQTSKRCLTQEFLIVNALKPSNFFGLVQRRKLISTGYLWTGDYDDTLEKGFVFLSLCVGLIELKCADQWELGSSQGGFIGMNTGVSTFFRLLSDLLRHEEANGFQPRQHSAEQIFNRIKHYILSLCDFINELDTADIQKLREYRGSGAVKSIFPEFQNAIYQQHEDYNPPGLQQWLKDSSGQFNPVSKRLGDEIQLSIRDFVFKKLKEEYGNQNWWSQGIDKEIQKYCSIASIDQGRNEPDENYLLTRHYQKIILDNKALFLEVFTPPGKANLKLEARTSWVVKLNNIRQKFSHPERAKVTEDEYNYLVNLSSWLLPRLTN